MRRREFIAGLGGTAAWPVVARAQQPDRMRQMGVLMGLDENDPEAKGWLSGFIQGLADLGWTGGRNLRIHVRWAAGNVERMRRFAKELADLQPEVILAHSTPVTAALQLETRTIPIVFVLVGDPVGDGFVAGLPRPGGNITGFMTQEAAIAGKWLELLTEIAPVKELRSFSTPTRRLIVGHITYLHSRPPPSRAKWNRSQRPFRTMPKSKRPSRRLGASPAAA